MDKINPYDALLQNSKKQEKRVHDFANHFSTLNYLIRNQHFCEAEHYIEQLIADLLSTQEEFDQLEHYKKHLLYQLYNLKLLLRSEATDAMLGHIHEIHKQLDTLIPEIYCDHALLNAVLCKKKREAIKHHINISYAISSPKEVSMPDPQLASVFFNLLDNAIEACRQSQTQKPFIQLKVGHKGNMLSIWMLNSKNPNISFSGKTTKIDKNQHGFGLEIIDDIVRSRSGYIQYKDLGDTFESRLMFEI